MVNGLQKTKRFWLNNPNNSSLFDRSAIEGIPGYIPLAWEKTLMCIKHIPVADLTALSGSRLLLTDDIRSVLQNSGSSEIGRGRRGRPTRLTCSLSASVGSGYELSAKFKIKPSHKDLGLRNMH